MSSNSSAKNKPPVQGLKKSFDARKSAVTNRASAVFPVYIRKNTDLHIVCLNYWKIKNNISPEDITFNIRIYDNEGALTNLFTCEKLNDHNQFSIKEMLQLNKFDGTAHVEILSIKNLRFPFPGIIGIYQSNDLFSAVHSAGRIKNTEEIQKVSYTNETNWVCKRDDHVTPFFHFFNGPNIPSKKTIKVEVHNYSDNNILISKDIDISDIPEFGSKIFLLDEIFKDFVFKDNYYVSVLVEHNSAFPRLVVGNLHKEDDFLEVTHSFPVIEEIDHVTVDQSKFDYESILCGFTSKDLTLDMRVFPTNCDGSFTAKYFSQKFGEDQLVFNGQEKQFNQGELSKVQDFKLSDNEQFLTVGLTGRSVPSRLNSTLIYKVKNQGKAKYNTNIARGSIASVYPPRYRQWGHGYLGDSYETVILIRNSSHKPTFTAKTTGKLSLYANDIKIEHEFSVEPESSIVINLSEVIGKNHTSFYKSGNFMSWFIEATESYCDSHWISYRKSDGAIFGDHSF